MADMVIGAVVGAQGRARGSALRAVAAWARRMLEAQVGEMAPGAARSERPARRPVSSFGHSRKAVWMIVPGSGAAWDV